MRIVDEETYLGDSYEYYGVFVGDCINVWGGKVSFLGEEYVPLSSPKRYFRHNTLYCPAVRLGDKIKEYKDGYTLINCYFIEFDENYNPINICNGDAIVYKE